MLAVAIASRGFCSKVHLESIPEWEAMREAIVQLDGALRPQTLAGATVEESLDAGGFAASVTLLLCMVRGMDGVSWLGCYLTNCQQQRLLRTDFKAFCEGLVSSFMEESLQRQPHWASHREGRFRIMSGPSPVRRLLTGSARAGFQKVCEAWAPTFAKALAGKCVTDGEIIALGTSSRGKIELALRKNAKTGRLSVVTGKKYFTMHVTRCLAAVFETCWGTPRISYTQKLHDFMQGNQGGPRADATDFSTESAAEVTARVEALTHTASSFLDVPPTGGTVTWQTYFVLRCESRQALNHFGRQALLEILHADPTRYADAVRRRAVVLREQGYVGNGTCHTRALLDVAAATLGIQAPKRHRLKRKRV